MTVISFFGNSSSVLLSHPIPNRHKKPASAELAQHGADQVVVEVVKHRALGGVCVRARSRRARAPRSDLSGLLRFLAPSKQVGWAPGPRYRRVWRLQLHSGPTIKRTGTGQGSVLLASKPAQGSSLSSVAAQKVRYLVRHFGRDFTFSVVSVNIFISMAIGHLMQLISWRAQRAIFSSI